MVARGETVLGARFTEIRHLGLGLYKLASAGGTRVFQPLCWGLVVKVPRRGIVLGAWVPWTRTSFFTLVEITSKPC